MGFIEIQMLKIEEKLQKQLRAILMRGAAFDYTIIISHWCGT